MDQKNAIRSESVLNQNAVKVYTDSTKLDGRVGAGFYEEYPNNSPKQAFFPPWNTQHYVPGRSPSYFRSGKEPAFEKNAQSKYCGIVMLVDSQASIKLLLKCTVTSITVLNCIRNLNQLRKQNHVSIAWIPGHAGVHGNEVADYLAKSRPKSKMHGPEPFITVPYASCVRRLRTGPQIDGNLCE